MTSLLVADSIAPLEKEPSGGTLESCTESMINPQGVHHTYADLLEQIRNDLRIQHPEWIQLNGESPMCVSYEARLLELLAASIRRRSNGPTAIPERAPEYGCGQIETAAKAV